MRIEIVLPSVSSSIFMYIVVIIYLGMYQGTRVLITFLLINVVFLLGRGDVDFKDLRAQ